MASSNYNSLSQNKSKINFWDIVIVYILHILSISFMSTGGKNYLGLFIVIMFLLALTIVKPTFNLLYLGALAGLLNIANSSSPIYSLIYFLVISLAIYAILYFNLLNNNPRISFFGVIAIMVIILDGRILNLIYNDLASVLTWSWQTILHILANYALFLFFLYLLQKNHSNGYNIWLK